MGEILYGIKFNIMNYLVPNIPFWCVRKMCYKLAGMKIGKAHILMKVYTDGWKNIIIEDGVCINQFCHLDGRGGLTIKKNASISVYSKIISASHDSHSPVFQYFEKPVLIGEYAWLGANSVVLPGTHLGKGTILAAGSVAIGKDYQDRTILSGVPAKKIGERDIEFSYDLSNWKPFFR